MTDLRTLWDFDDPPGSEQRLRAAAEVAEGAGRLVLLTQVARALGLQGRYDEGHSILDDLAVSDDGVAARVSLERGRLLLSSGSPDQARPHFEPAERWAADARDDAMRVDAVHLLAQVVDPADRVATNERGLAIAAASPDPAVRDWDATLLDGIGTVHAEAGDWRTALAVFEQALAARERIGDPEATRVARWRVAWVLRHLGRTDEAIALQRQLRSEL